MLTLLTACGGAPSPMAEADFPTDAIRWDVPLERPLTRLNPWVTVELKGTAPPGGQAPVLRLPMIVDSGAFIGTVLSTANLKALGLEVYTNTSVQTVDAANRRRPWRGSTVPEMRLGPLVLRDVVVSQSPQLALLGQNLLGVMPWEIDLDRGRLVFGAPPMEGGVLASLDLTRRDGMYYTTAQLDGRDVLLYFDTGASTTSVDHDTCRDLGLKSVHLAEAKVYTTVSTRVTVSHNFRAMLSMGGLPGEQIEITPLLQHRGGALLNEKVVGLLGFDAMAHFRFRVNPGEQVEFAPRGDLVATVPGRLSRWSWVPDCEGHPGCVDVQTQAVDGRVQARLDFTQAYPEAASFLFGCVGPDARVDHTLGFIEVNRKIAGPVQETLTLPPPTPDRSALYGYTPERCPVVKLLDVNPVKPDEAGPGDGRFTLVPSVLAPRHLRD